MTREEMYAALMAGQVVLGIELGSTRIKSVLLTQASGEVIATGGFDWENQLEDGIWTYHLDQVQLGVQESFRKLAHEVQPHYRIQLRRPVELQLPVWGASGES